MTGRHPSKTKPYLAPTQPEFPAPQPLAEAPHGGKRPESTIPSPGKSQRGRYAIHSARESLQGMVEGLSSSQPDVRSISAKKLKAYADDAEKARDVVGLLPPDSPSNRLISDVRAHCIAHIRKEIR